MENPASFDLNQAIQQWRQQLAASPAIRREDVDELESHLRDTVVAMESKGLTAAEAFWIARHRLGTGEALQSEFAKVNTSQIWLDRALWMIAGFLGICSISSFTHSLSNLIAIGLHQWDFPGWSIGLTGTLLNMAVVCYVLSVVFRSARRSHTRLINLGRWSLAHPIAAAVAICGLQILLAAGGRGIFSIMVSKLAARNLAEVMSPMWAISILQMLLWPLLFGWLLAKSRHQAHSLSQP